ncbi:MAG: hypothetical protein OEY66_02120 [Gammaproteobacteria bacterium]|nr:hypothetical protein [Gammaproteobacteria bacterium]
MVIVFVLLFGKLPDSNLFWRELQNSGHTLLFIPIAVFILLLLQDASKVFWQNPFKLYMAACLISLLIGIIIELIQLIMSRDASLIDVVRDLTGIIVGLGLRASVDPELLTYRMKAGKKMATRIVMLSFFVFAVSMSPLALISASYLQREIAFPVIVDLTANWMQPFLRLNNAVIDLPESSEEIRIDKEGQLTRVEFKRGIYPGVSIIETFPDWSAYRVLTIIVYSKLMQPFELILRIHDDQHNDDYSDRFNSELAINEGVNYFHILLEDIEKAPLNREMNMTQIKGVTLFSALPADGLQFYVGAMRLE